MGWKLRKGTKPSLVSKTCHIYYFLLCLLILPVTNRSIFFALCRWPSLAEYITYSKYSRGDPALQMHLCSRKNITQGYQTFTRHCSIERGTKWQSGFGGTKPPLGQTESISHKQKNFSQSISSFGKAELPHKQGDLSSREGCPYYWLVVLTAIHYPSFPTACFVYFRHDSKEI